MKGQFHPFFFFYLFVTVRGRPEPPVPYNTIPVMQLVAPSSPSHAQIPQAYGSAHHPSLESMVRANQMKQQQYLNSQYQLLQQREQEQLLKEKELERIKEEIWKELQGLESKKQEAYGAPQQNLATLDYGAPPLGNTGTLEYGAPHKNVPTQGYEAPGESVAKPQYGPPHGAVAPHPAEEVVRFSF